VRRIRSVHYRPHGLHTETLFAAGIRIAATTSRPSFHHAHTELGGISGHPAPVRNGGNGSALEILHRAGQEQEKWRQSLADFEEEMANLGFPLASHANFGGAPFDAISDYLRGMRGTMLDM